MTGEYGLSRVREVLQKVGFSRSTLYRLVGEGKFPRPVMLTGGKSVAWRDVEVQQWIDSRPYTCASQLKKKGAA